MSERTDDLMIKYMLLDTYIERRVDKRVDVEGWERRTPHKRSGDRCLRLLPLSHTSRSTTTGGVGEGAAASSSSSSSAASAGGDAARLTVAAFFEMDDLRCIVPFLLLPHPLFLPISANLSRERRRGAMRDAGRGGQGDFTFARRREAR